MMADTSGVKKSLRIGVDVGGTNTDGVILDPSRSSDPDRGIIAWHKAPTTPDPSDSINDAIKNMFESSAVEPGQIASITIGTTHFVNSVVQRDASRLSRVAVIRLCGPFSKHVPPCIDWPDDLRELILGYYVLARGGLEVDGEIISDIDTDEIKSQCDIIREMGIRSVVVNGVFSPIDTIECQEERVAEIVRSEIPGCDVICSRDVANLGFLERENSAILNAAILAFARSTIRSFQEPVARLGLRCPVFISQNDGTVLTGELATKLPIRTFSSGPTNSMRGAAFLLGKELDGPLMVVDIGGTTTDVGILLANGFPRQQAAYSDLAGVRMNFSCPDIKSIGLGGGSVVRKHEPLSLGPESVGYRLTEEAMSFGGTVLTATDCAVHINPDLGIGKPELVQSALSEEEKRQFASVVRAKLERIIDTMKTSPEDLPVLLVGGGAVIAPDELKGASKVLKPKWSEVANAIGAATSGVSAVVDVVRPTESTTTGEVFAEVQREAINKTIQSGATPVSVRIVEMETLPLQYIANKSRFIVRAAGDFDLSRTDLTSAIASDTADSDSSVDSCEKSLYKTAHKRTPAADDVDILAYIPEVRDRVWYISELDVEWISVGCYILGTGGGGSPYSQMILLREKLRAGAIVRVVSPHDLPDNALVGSGGGAGSPTVAIEKLSGDEMLESQQELYKIIDQRQTHMIAVEIGGGNGLQSMILGASTALDVPTVDGDWMGRAYPTKWQTTPVVFNERTPIWTPVVMADGNGNVVVMPKAASDVQVERVLRAALSQMGSQVGFADPPVSGAETKRWVVENTISQAWRIGRAVAIAKRLNDMDGVAERIIDACGGPEAAQVLWEGKIVGVERTLRMGHVYGECIIEGMDVTGGGGQDRKRQTSPQSFEGCIKIPFKNENIAAIRMRSGGKMDADDGGEQEADVLAIVPDLVCVLDARNGEAIGTPEYRYGLLVIVLGIVASDRWTGTERGISIGGPAAFGFEHLSYKSLGKFVKPRSVIEEFGSEG